jgi:hypothetical protein
VRLRDAVEEPARARGFIRGEEEPPFLSELRLLLQSSVSESGLLPFLAKARPSPRALA